jgi:hypothetical protein
MVKLLTNLTENTRRHMRLSLVLFAFFLSGNAIMLSQTTDLKKAHYSSKQVMAFDKKLYDLSGFEKREKKDVPLDVLKLVDEAFLDHPDLGISVHPGHKDALELVDKRDIYHSTYVMPDGTTIFSSSAQALNYVDENGWFREILYTLDEKPHVDNVYRAANQPIPKSINLLTGQTGFETPLGNITINQQSKVRFLNGNEEIGSVHSLNMSQKEIGKNGLFVTNAYPNIDMQVILLSNGYIKTNYIIKDRSAINPSSEFMVFEDIVTLPDGMRFDFDTEQGIHNGNEMDWEGNLVVRNHLNQDVFHYMSPFIYDDNYTQAMVTAPLSTYNKEDNSVEEQGVDSDAFTYAAYRVEKINETTYKVSVIVKTAWLLAEERSFPVVIDPVTFTGSSLTFTAGNFCARRVSGTMPVDNPGPGGVGCYSTTTVLPAGYMLIASQPVRVYSGYKTRGCAASSTWMKYYGPCGMFPRESGFFYFCNINLGNVDCGTAAGGNPMDGILSKCLLSAGEDCAAATAPSCANQTITFSVCYQTRCFANAAGTCATTSTQFPNGTNANYVEAGIADFRVDIMGEKITHTLAGGGNVCPNTVNNLTLTTRFGVPNALSTANCTDQMGGTYSWSATTTGGALSAASGTTNTVGVATPTWTAPAAAGTYTVTTTVCNTNCNAPAATMCDTKSVTFTVGPSVAPIVSDLVLCNNVSGVPAITNPQGGYTYTWENGVDGAGAVIGTGTSRTIVAVNNSTVTYSVRATAPCVSSWENFTITWGPPVNPVTTGVTICPGGSATLLANCGTDCEWYTAAAGGASFNSTGSYVINPVVGPVTYFVEYNAGAGCVSGRTPVTLSTNALTVTTNPTGFDPICPGATANFSASVSGNTDVTDFGVTNLGPETINDNSACTGPDCTTANSGLLSVATPAGVSSPLTAGAIQSVCFTTVGATWCGAETRFYLRSPSGTVFTLYGGRATNSKTQDATNSYCFDDIASSTVIAPTMGAGQKIASGTYLADGGNLSNAFTGETAAAGSLWSLIGIDNTLDGCGSLGLVTITNFTLTFGITVPPTISWSGGPPGGTLSSGIISNPVFTPPDTGGAFDSDYTVTYTDATGCTGTATVNVVCSLPLPLELLSFYGDIGDRNNTLHWKTMSEKNTESFKIERSTDGINFEKIGSVKAAGQSSTLKQYSFVDEHRYPGKNYYRLKMFDVDGVFTHSDIILMEAKQEAVMLSLIPNPATKMIEVIYDINFETNTTIKVYDFRGSLVSSHIKESKKGSNNFILNLEDFAPGVYNVVVNNDGIISTSRDRTSGV